MALTPYQRRVGLPDSPGPSNRVDTRVVDISGNIAGLGRQLQDTFAEQHKAEAIEAGSKAAGDVVLERDEGGNIILPRATEGGTYARAAFNAMLERKYVNEVNLSWQMQLNDDLAARRTGDAPYDPEDFKMKSLAKLEGIVAGAAPEVRVELSELLAREMLERTRSFEDEHSRTVRAQSVAGWNDLIAVRKDRLANALERGWSAERIAEEKAGLMADLDHMEQMYFASPIETAATMMAADDQIADVTNFIRSSREVVELLPIIGQLNEQELEALEAGLSLPYGVDGEVLDTDVSGLVAGSAAYVAPVEAAAGSPFGAPRDGGTRSHKGIDFPAPAGTLVKPGFSLGGTASVGWSEKGGNIVTVAHDNGTVTRYMHLGKVNVRDGQRIDAGTILGTVGRTGNATGNTLHYEILPDGKNAVDPLSLMGKEVSVEDSEQTKIEVAGITGERIRGWDPAVRAQAVKFITDRRAVIREEERVARQEAADAAREAREAARMQQLQDSITGALDNGVGGNWNAEQRGVLNRGFDAAIDWSRIDTPEMQQEVSQFVSQNQYVPESLQNWFANSVRSPNWASALSLYDRLDDTTMSNGAKVGDLMVEELDASSRSLFEYARTLRNSGTNAETIGHALEKVRDGTGFTPRSATTAYNEFKEKGDTTYQQDRNKALREQYGVPERSVLLPELQKRIDASFAANLSIYAGEPQKALKLAIEQNKSVMQRSAIFVGGVGPAALRRTFTPNAIQEFLGGERDQDGKPLIPPGKGWRLGENIKLEPLESSLTSIGRYRVLFFDPANPSRFMGSLELDLGDGLRNWKTATTRTSNRRNAIAAARATRTRIQGRARNRAERDQAAPFAGPKI